MRTKVHTKALALFGVSSLVLLAGSFMYEASGVLVSGGVERYATSTFSVSYPQGYSVDERYENEIAPGRRSTGVKFTINPSMTDGTNLSADSFVSVELLPTMSACSASPYLSDPVIAQALYEGDTTYSVALSSGAGAGNFYEEAVYARLGDKGCVAVRYVIHSTNIGNYDPGTVRKFDKEALLKEFDGVRRSLTLL